MVNKINVLPRIWSKTRLRTKSMTLRSSFETIPTKRQHINKIIWKETGEHTRKINERQVRNIWPRNVEANNVTRELQLALKIGVVARCIESQERIRQSVWVQHGELGATQHQLEHILIVDDWPERLFLDPVAKLVLFET